MSELILWHTVCQGNDYSADKETPYFNGIRKFITVFTKAYHECPEPFQSIPHSEAPFI